ncbi:zn-dependent hydrolase of the beta-lactamase fold protein [Anopheles sinensis]|uniref:Zn-dependent hydrolase of the beta-lactamase fold protein n=1 Tax=Anopheles sinensis TaxID=74873 RepID=A0A084VZK2_ANOSI|nr:zn-dependent hydrolase of the beta-lactamase fold protein [Anopheles sinensis]
MRPTFGQLIGRVTNTAPVLRIEGSTLHHGAVTCEEIVKPNIPPTERCTGAANRRLSHAKTTETERTGEEIIPEQLYRNNTSCMKVTAGDRIENMQAYQHSSARDRAAIARFDRETEACSNCKTVQK